MPTFGENLRSLRKSRGYSQEKMAEVCQTNQTNISCWELNQRTPHLGTIKRIADIFKVPLYSLISFESADIDPDFLQEVICALQSNPKIHAIFDKVIYMSDDNLNAVLAVVNAISPD